MWYFIWLPNFKQLQCCIHVGEENTVSCCFKCFLKSDLLSVILRSVKDYRLVSESVSKLDILLMLLPYFVMVFLWNSSPHCPICRPSMLNSGTHYFFSLICRYGILPDFAVPGMFLYFCCSLFIYFIVLWPFDNLPPLIQYMGHEALFFSRVVSLSVCACKHLGSGIATSLPSKEFKLHSVWCCEILIWWLHRRCSEMNSTLCYCT